MTLSGIVTIDLQHAKLRRAAVGLCVIILLQSYAFEVPAQNAGQNEQVIPFTELLKKPIEIRKELTGVHPRLFFTANEISGYRLKSKGSGRELWKQTLDEIQTLNRAVPDPKDEDLYKSGLDKRKAGSITQYSFAFQISQTAFAYVIEQDARYLTAAKKWTLAACDMPIWGYTYNKPNVDLPPAHLLYAVAFSYDLLYDKFTSAEREIIRNKLVSQGRLMYDYFKYKPGKRYTYTQNHTWIPMAGLAIAAYVLMDEVEEARKWAQLSRSVYDRTMQSFGTDGYFYESFHYFGFAFRWAIRYFDVHKQVTGEDLYVPMKSKLAGMKYYAMHSILPDGENVFDFADVGDGSLNRNGTSKRESLYGEYDILHRLAAVYQDSEAQAIGDFVLNETKLETREPMWAFINRDSDLKPASLSQIPLFHRFEDNDTIFWRSDWTKKATAFAFRCAPPEGHHAAKLASKISDWRQNTGHAHPDANSFIIWANGKYLTGDTGYLGIKQTDNHNTILVNGRGQEKEGVYEMFKEVPNERLDHIRIAESWTSPQFFYARGEAASGYFPDLGMKRFDRHFLYVAPDYFLVWDELETKEPAKFTFMLNADREITLAGITADLVNGDAVLRVERLSSGEVQSEVIPQLVQARGLPGSVDKGESEQRGVQLRTTNITPAAKTEFLHLFEVASTKNDRSLSRQISFGGKSGPLFSIAVGAGDHDTVCLTSANCSSVSDANRLIVRHSKDGKVTRLIWQTATRINSESVRLMEASKPVSGSIIFLPNGRVSGYISSKTETRVKLRTSIMPEKVFLNGADAKFEKNEASVSFWIPPGQHHVEFE